MNRGGALSAPLALPTERIAHLDAIRRLLRCGISTRLCPLWVIRDRVSSGPCPLRPESRLLRLGWRPCAKSGRAVFNKTKQCRRVAARYDKLAANYVAFVQLSSTRLRPR